MLKPWGIPDAALSFILVRGIGSRRALFRKRSTNVSFAIERPTGVFAFGAPPGSAAGQTVAGLGAFSEAAYRQSDQIRRSIDLPPAQSGTRPGVSETTLGGALAGFVASPDGHAALERLANAAGGWFEKAFGVAAEAEQLALPLA